MPPTIPTGGVITADNFDEFSSFVKGALVHTIEQGEVPAFAGKPMTAEAARDFALAWVDSHKGTLIEGGFDFLSGLARRLVVGDGPQETLEEFEAGLSSLTDEQLTVLSELEADQVQALKADVIDRRRKMLADLLETGKTLLRGAVSSGLFAMLGAS